MTNQEKESSIWQASRKCVSVKLNGELFDPYLVVIDRLDSRKRYAIGRLHILTSKEAFRFDLDDIKNFETTDEKFEPEDDYRKFDGNKYYNG